MTERSGLSWAGPMETKAIEDLTREELVGALIMAIGEIESSRQNFRNMSTLIQLYQKRGKAA